MDENKETNWGEEGEQTAQTVGSFIWELVRVFIIALAIIVPLRIFVAEPFIVSGSSMVPNYHNREYLIIDKVSYRSHEPQRGEVIVLRYPKDPSQYFIKRIIALPGETVKVDQGSVYIYNETNPAGFKLEESYLPNEGITFGSNEPVTLAADQYYVLGDNRLASSDSRVWGILPEEDIIGKVWVRVFPITSFGFSEKASYPQS
ncbi:MAG: signal peptidase I [Candidatus Doudnabacteria bacterium]|nr:signal peptidase I [Candidatus Doudnabacteria bacterium]